jgi:glycosyltransferase involved in cell wall biosynthesis
VVLYGSSGQPYSLHSANALPVQARLRGLLAFGQPMPAGCQPANYDYIYTASNFMRSCVTQNWGAAARQIFTCPRGVVPEFYAPPAPARDPFRLAYSGHPEKGLPAALAVLRQLRAVDARFHLQVFGGHALWGQPQAPQPAQAGVHYCGVLGQRALARALQGCGFALALQARQEPFGMAVLEAQRAGCVVIASAAGAFPEIVDSGVDGFLLPGAPAGAVAATAGLILELLQQPQRLQALRNAAQCAALPWSVVAAAYAQHWAWALRGGALPAGGPACVQCSAPLQEFASGLHCVQCGAYTRGGSAPAAAALSALQPAMQAVPA